MVMNSWLLNYITCKQAMQVNIHKGVDKFLYDKLDSFLRFLLLPVQSPTNFHWILAKHLPIYAIWMAERKRANRWWRVWSSIPSKETLVLFPSLSSSWLLFLSSSNQQFPHQWTALTHLYHNTDSVPPEDILYNGHMKVLRGQMRESAFWQLANTVWWSVWL